MDSNPLFQDRKFSPTPAGICEAARAGDVRSIELILCERPDLLVADNPHNWSKNVPKHEVRGAHFQKPVEVASFFNQPYAVRVLLEFSRHTIALKKPWTDHLAFDGHFNSLRIAGTLGHQDVIDVIEADIEERLRVQPALLDEHDIDGKTLLHYAAEQSCLTLFESLLNRGANSDATMTNGRSVLHCLLDEPVNEKRNDLAKRMIGQGVAHDLWVASALNDNDRVRELVKSGKHIANKHYRPDQAKLSDGFPLVRAATTGSLEIVELLLKHGANVNGSHHDAKQVESAIANGNYSNVPNEFGMPLIAAVYTHQYEIANMLLDHGASPYAYAHCADSLADMLYKARLRSGPDWLALGELRYATTNPTSHLQPSRAGNAEIVSLHQRVDRAGGSPQLYSVVAAKQYDEIKKRLAEPKDETRTFAGKTTVLRAISEAAAWGGDEFVMRECLDQHASLMTPAETNRLINEAIRSHNRNGDFKAFSAVIRANLDYLRQQAASITCKPFWHLAAEFLETYNYGLHDRLPTMPDLLELARLFLEYGADLDERDATTNRTALAEASNRGHSEYVEFLLNNGATVFEDDPPSSNPIALARMHGFSEILSLLGESDDNFDPPKHPLESKVEKPTTTEFAIEMAPVSHAKIQVGSVEVSHSFAPKSEDGDTHIEFVPFERPFPDHQFAHVRMLVSNQNHPQIIASVTTCALKGQQGFLLKAKNSTPRDAESCTVDKPTSFSWLAVLLTNKPQPERFDFRYGMLPQCEDYDEPYKTHRYEHTETLFQNGPLSG